MQVASLQETHNLLANMLNTARAGFSRADSTWIRRCWRKFPSNLDFVRGAGPGGIVVQRRSDHQRDFRACTSAGPNNAAGVWNRRNLFTYTDDVQIFQGNPPDQRRRVVSARPG